MKIVNFQIEKLTLPFKFSFNHSLAKRDKMEALLLVLRDENGCLGFGEATPRAYVTGESLEKTISDLSQYLTEIKNIEINDLEDLKVLLSEPTLAKSPSLAVAIELAVLDLLSKNARQNIQDYLNIVSPIKNKVLTYSAVISSSALSKVKEMVEMAAKFHLTDIKLKLSEDLSMNEEMIAIVKDIFPEANMRGDVNAGWDLDNALQQIPILAQ